MLGCGVALTVLAAPAVALAPAAAADPAALDPTGNYSGGPVPTMNGIPCVGGSLGVCISMRQNNPSRSGATPPRANVGHSPTVRR
ncbi:hypothetical protein AFA91_11945 [Mycolicibacterium goodii]|uniref:Intersectin-EH binding protein Ibp1 n=1 Tax=Mycolicibacterium goodii TaxID=134601 RepID=A0A0K0X518_MYCGD|nr:hypothetical protein AFA91_11945 [Mycolicibacterium goodii]